MINPSALSWAATALRDHLITHLKPSKPIISIGDPGSTLDPAMLGKDGNRLNLFFYRIEYAGYPSAAGNEDQQYVRIFCLLTPATTTEINDAGAVSAGEQDLRLLGHAMHVLQVKPLLPVNINKKRVAQLEIVPHSLSLDDLNKVWATQPGVNYRTSVAYELALMPVPEETPVTKPKPRVEFVTYGVTPTMAHRFPGWCDLRLTVASDYSSQEKLIRNFKTEFDSKPNECAVLIVRGSRDSEEWTVAGFSDEGEFRTVVVDPSHELSAELKKEPINQSESTIVKLATSSLGRNLPRPPQMAVCTLGADVPRLEEEQATAGWLPHLCLLVDDHRPAHTTELAPGVSHAKVQLMATGPTGLSDEQRTMAVLVDYWREAHGWQPLETAETLELTEGGLDPNGHYPDGGKALIIPVDEPGQLLIQVRRREEWLDEPISSGYDLNLISVDAADGLDGAGNSLIIVALVRTDLHIRIFNASGEKVFDKAEKELAGGEILRALKRRLTPFPAQFALSPQDKQEIIGHATSIAGRTLASNAVLVVVPDGERM